ncbi:hypothetical protein YC2023_025014 [Brassica napus]
MFVKGITESLCVIQFPIFLSTQHMQCRISHTLFCLFKVYHKWLRFSFMKFNILSKHVHNVAPFRDRSSVDVKSIANGALKISERQPLELTTQTKLVTESENCWRALAWNTTPNICNPLAFVVILLCIDRINYPLILTPLCKEAEDASSDCYKHIHRFVSFKSKMSERQPIECHLLVSEHFLCSQIAYICAAMQVTRQWNYTMHERQPHLTVLESHVFALSLYIIVSLRWSSQIAKKNLYFIEVAECSSCKCQELDAVLHFLLNILLGYSLRVAQVETLERLSRKLNQRFMLTSLDFAEQVQDMNLQPKVVRMAEMEELRVESHRKSSKWLRENN